MKQELLDRLAILAFPEHPLDNIIQSVKEKYISHHLKDKSYRRAALYCGISRSMIRRTADTIGMNQFQTEQV